MRTMPKRRVTPFALWYRAHGAPHPYLLGQKLGCSDASIRVYLAGRSVPKPAMLRRLRDLTGLPSDAFLYPFEWKPEQNHEAA